MKIFRKWKLCYIKENLQKIARDWYREISGKKNDRKK